MTVRKNKTMILNLEYLKILNKYKLGCANSDVSIIETTEQNEFFYSDFSVYSFQNQPKIRGAIRNCGRKTKTSCIIRKTKVNSFIIQYYSKGKENIIELFPNNIKRVTYKV